MTSYPKSLLSGLIGAAIVTALNESVRRVYSPAPRLEKLGMDAAAKSLQAAGAEVPAKKPLFWGTLAADVISNALYYSVLSLAGKGGRWALGTGLGLAAGIGAVMLPEPLHLDASTTNRTNKTKALTVAWYLIGAWAATAVASFLSGEGE